MMSGMLYVKKRSGMKTMANKYYNIDKSPYYTNCYFIHASEEVHKCFLEAPKNNPFSYQMIIIGLFGLEPSDFFKYIQVKYNAKVLKKEKSIKIIDSEEIETLDELERREIIKALNKYKDYKKDKEKN